MERLQQDHRVAEDTLGETMLVLVVAKGYLARLMRNEAVSSYLSRHHPELSAELVSVMEAARRVGLTQITFATQSSASGRAASR